MLHMAGLTLDILVKGPVWYVLGAEQHFVLPASFDVYHFGHFFFQTIGSKKPYNIFVLGRPHTGNLILEINQLTLILLIFYLLF